MYKKLRLDYQIPVSLFLLIFFLSIIYMAYIFIYAYLAFLNDRFSFFNLFFIFMIVFLSIFIIFSRGKKKCIKDRIKNITIVERINEIFSVLFLVYLSLFILLSVFLNILPTIQTQILLIITIVLGIIIFLFNKDKLEDIEKESELEKAQEKKREMEFNTKYPLINKISGIRLIVRWMYKEGWWYSCGLLLLVLIGFGLRIWDLDFLSPMRDEYLHLVGAKRFMIEDTFNYSRAAFLTYIIGFLFKFNDNISVFLARFPSVVFGTASIVAIYFLAKKIVTIQPPYKQFTF